MNQFIKIIIQSLHETQFDLMIEHYAKDAEEGNFDKIYKDFSTRFQDLSKLISKKLQKEPTPYGIPLEEIFISAFSTLIKSIFKK